MTSRKPAAVGPLATNRVIAKRLEGMPVRAAEKLRQAVRDIDRGDLASAELALLTASVVAPDHSEILRWSGVVQMTRGHSREALADFSQSLLRRPNDAVVLTLLSAAEYASGDDAASLRSLMRAMEFACDAQEWMNVGLEFDRQGHIDHALNAVEKVIALDANDASARLLRARCLHTLGESDAAASEYRRLLSRNTLAASAWFGLLDQKTVQIESDELKALELADRSVTKNSGDERTLLAFALGAAYEQRGDYTQAFATFSRANSYARSTYPWDAAALSRQVDAIERTFQKPTAHADFDQGREVIFVVGLPRSGTTLIEQTLAAHPDVEGASELPYLQRVIGEESNRRRVPFPEWVAAATSADWTRLGQQYLTLSARWRQRRPRATDKMPSNWLLVGAIAAMLPQSRIVGLWRDPIETGWSCFKQLFAHEMAGFAYDFDSIAAYWRDYDRLGRFWARSYPRQFRAQNYEQFVSNHASETRHLLDFCGLAFDEACLQPHQAQRSVRTASAAQVRQPIRQNTARTSNYGELLDPLRLLLATAQSDAETVRQ
jgi:tetratricopeptide (TPR) repeat protein